MQDAQPPPQEDIAKIDYHRPLADLSDANDDDPMQPFNIHPKKLLRFSGASLCMVAACGSTAVLSAKASEPNAILFPGPRGQRAPTIPVWRSVPDDVEFQQALPAGVTTNGTVQWECAVRRDGRLMHCKVQAAWPDNNVFAAAARPLLKRYVLTPQSVREAYGSRSKVLLTMTLWRPGLAHPEGCPPPFCVPVPPPPPPPPPPPHQ